MKHCLTLLVLAAILGCNSETNGTSNSPESKVTLAAQQLLIVCGPMTIEKPTQRSRTIVPNGIWITTRFRGPS